MRTFKFPDQLTKILLRSRICQRTFDGVPRHVRKEGAYHGAISNWVFGELAHCFIQRSLSA
jgi:hypothetical protein